MWNGQELDNNVHKAMAGLDRTVTKNDLYILSEEGELSGGGGLKSGDWCWFRFSDSDLQKR